MTGKYHEMDADSHVRPPEEFELGISHQVIEAVAKEKGEDPVELRPPLFDAVNPEALDTIYQSDGISVTFVWQGCTIQIDGNGAITVQENE